MKKVYLVIFAMSAVSVGFSQEAFMAKESQSKRMTTVVSASSSNGKVENNVAKAVIFQEDFETWPLTGWTIQSGPNSTTTQPAQKWHQTANGNPGSCASVLYVNSVNRHDEELITPEISLPSGGNYYFAFDFNTSIYWHALALGGNFDNADIYLQASTDNGASWSNILWQEDSLALLEASFSEGWTTYVWKRAYVNVSSFEGENVRFKFTYYGLDAAQFSVDNVTVEDIEDNDIRVRNFYQTAGTLEADYYIIPSSQESFPGLTFGASAQNLGGVDQPTVTLRVTGESYDESSSSVAINVGAIDTLSISTPFMVPATIGDYTIAMTTELGAETDANPANNSTSIVVRRDLNLYARDNGIISGSIDQISSQTNGEGLHIGNVFEVFDDMTITDIQIRLTNQPEAEGQSIDARIDLYNPSTDEFDHYLDTDILDIEASHLNSFVTLPLSSGPELIPAGSILLVMAHHYGGLDPVAFGYAQPTFEGSVRGITNAGTYFQLLEPRAIMIRLGVEAPVVSIKNAAKLEGVSVYPNPSSGVINISNDTNVENTIVVTDLTGKVISSKVANAATTIDLSLTGTGVYFVEVTNENGRKVERVIIN